MNSIDLHNKCFRAVSNSANGQVSSLTTFHYRQKGNKIWGTYWGGSIRFGTLNGIISGTDLRFNYRHRDESGAFFTGKCQSKALLKDGIIYLSEEWQWTCDDYSKGESELIQIME